MRKLGIFLGALMLTFSFVSCDRNDDPIIPDDIIEDGFYVIGAATGFTSLSQDGAVRTIMATGINEVGQTSRAGMFEKYIVLQGGQPFSLILREGQDETRFGATLARVNLANEDGNSQFEQPPIEVYRGVMTEGGTLQVAETGLYHIVLDLNLDGSLDDRLILIAPVTWGVRGAMNGWGWTEMTANHVSSERIVFTITDQEMPTGGAFKFAYGGVNGGGWKINLYGDDYDVTVKANANLGGTATVLTPGGDDITAIGAAGVYTITLTFQLAQGAVQRSFSWGYTLTGTVDLPENMYMIGADFGSWDWASDGVVALTPVHGRAGEFWTIRHIEEGVPFKFNSVRDWNGTDFAGLGDNTGEGTYFEFAGGNVEILESGIYMIHIDIRNNQMTIEPARVYLTGEPLTSGWGNEAAAYLFSMSGTTLVSPVFANSGNLRMFAASNLEGASDWWTREFNVFDGRIEYRGTGGDQAAVPATAGQRVTLNFNAGTGTIN